MFWLKKYRRIATLVLALTSIGYGGVDYLVIRSSALNDPSGWENDLTSLLVEQGHQLAYYYVSNGISNTSIRATIQGYSLTYPDLKYVLLIGQGEDNPVPPGGTYPETNHITNISTGNYIPFYYYNDAPFWAGQIRDIPSDKQYVDGLNLFIGRVPAATVAQVRTWVSKLSVHYQSLSQYEGYKNKIRIFCQNNYSPYNFTLSSTAENEVNKTDGKYIAVGRQEYVVHWAENIAPGNPGNPSPAMDAVFRAGLMEGAGLTVVSGTAGAPDNLGGFFFNPGTSNYSLFTNAKSNFIWGNTCALGNTSHPEQDNVLKNLLFDANTGLTGFFGPTVATSTHSTHVYYDNVFNDLINNGINTTGALASSASNAFYATTNIDYVRRGNIAKPFDPNAHNYHVRSMVLYGDPSMPLALNQYVNANITTNTTWQGSIVVESDITVQSGATLTILPGTGVFFEPGTKLTINGKLVAQGTTDFRIAFTSASASPAAGDWAGIKFLPGANGSSVIDYAIIEYADSAISVRGAADGIQITNSTLRYLDFVAIYASGTSLDIIGNTLIEPGTKGIHLYDLTASTIDHNDISGYSAGNYQYTFGIYLNACDDGNTVVSHNSIHDGGIYPEYGEGIRTVFSNVEFIYNDIYNTDKGVLVHGSPYPNFGYNYIHDNRYGLQIVSGNPLFVTNNGYGHNVISNHNKDGFYVHTSAAPVLGWAINPGYNDLMGNNWGNAYTNQIYTFSTTIIGAKYDWWGTSSPSSADVYRGSGSAYFSPWLNAADDPFAPGEEQPGSLGKGVASPEGQLLAEAQALTDQGDLTGAMGLFEELVADYPETEEAQMGLQLYVRVLFRADQFHGKAQYFNVMSNSPNHPLRDLARIFWIDAALENGQYPDVVNYFKVQINRNRGTIIEADAYLQMGQIYLDYADDKEAAQFEYDKLAAKFPESEFLPLLDSFIEDYQPGGDLAKRSQARATAARLQEEVLPEKFALHAAYPNPFNPTTTIPFDLPEATPTMLVVYDILGREVAQLVDQTLEAGYHTVIWDGKTATGRNVPSGIYIALMRTPTFTKSIKLVLLK